MFEESETEIYGKISTQEFLPSFFFWAFYVILIGASLLNFIWIRYYFMISIILWIVISKFGGIDQLELKMYLNSRNAKK